MVKAFLTVQTYKESLITVFSNILSELNIRKKHDYVHSDSDLESDLTIFKALENIPGITNIRNKKLDSKST